VNSKIFLLRSTTTIFLGCYIRCYLRLELGIIWLLSNNRLIIEKIIVDVVTLINDYACIT
jgi:hypothetical protein